MKKIATLITKIDEAELKGREIFLAGSCLLLLGLVIGLLISPKGQRTIGSNNGNDNGNNNTGNLPDAFFDDED